MFLITPLNREPVPDLGSNACFSKISTQRQVTVGKKAGHLGRWQTNVSQIIFPVEMKPEGCKGKAGDRRGATCGRSRCPGCYSSVDMTLNRLAGLCDSYFRMQSGLIFWESLVLHSSRPVVCKSQEK